MLKAFVYEMEVRKNYLHGEEVESIYFGGGTPSLLDAKEIEFLCNELNKRFKIHPSAEVTLEANPDDLSLFKLREIKQCGINRLSIGIQSFFDEHLQFMNRSHHAEQAIRCLKEAQAMGFDNLSLDLIFGFPQLSDEQWQQNIETAISTGATHISCYGMTVEPKTALEWQIRQHKIPELNVDHSANQYVQLMKELQKAGYEHYEISNFAKPGRRAVHNSNYWNSKMYLGIGPSAHSFNGETRQWNVANNAHYIRGVQMGEQIAEVEILSREQRLNETIMIQLRRMEGIDLSALQPSMTIKEYVQFQTTMNEWIMEKKLRQQGDQLQLTQEGKLFADGIAGSLFLNTYTESLS